MCIRMHLHVPVCMFNYICIYVRMCTYAYDSRYICIYVSTYVYTSICTWKVVT